MPVVVGPENWPQWLGEKTADARQLQATLAPYPPNRDEVLALQPRVGNVKNNDPSLIEPLAAR